MGQAQQKTSRDQSDQQKRGGTKSEKKKNRIQESRKQFAWKKEVEAVHLVQQALNFSTKRGLIQRTEEKPELKGRTRFSPPKSSTRTIIQPFPFSFYQHPASLLLVCITTLPSHPNPKIEKTRKQKLVRNTVTSNSNRTSKQQQNTETAEQKIRTQQPVNQQQQQQSENSKPATQKNRSRKQRRKQQQRRGEEEEGCATSSFPATAHHRLRPPRAAAGPLRPAPGRELPLLPHLLFPFSLFSVCLFFFFLLVSVYLYRKQKNVCVGKWIKTNMCECVGGWLGPALFFWFFSCFSLVTKKTVSVCFKKK